MTSATISIFVLIFFIGNIGAAIRPKIIGGENAEIEDFPFLVSIRSLTSFGHRKHYCGGSIISDRHILTAAHCVTSDDDYSDDDDDDDEVTIHSGISNIDQKGTVHKVLSVHSHPKFDKTNSKEGYPHDIAVLTLEKPIVFNKHQQKIKLPSHNVENYQSAYVIGWGRQSKVDHSRSRQLQKLRVNLLPSDKCKPLMIHKINPEQICSFKKRSTSGACYGDSGGPLVSHGEVLGIVSYGDTGVCANGDPVIYTNVFAYKDFIESVMNK